MAPRYASIEDYHATLGEEDRRICDILRGEIDAALPQAESRIWHNVPVWFIEDNPIVGYGRLKHSLRLLFWSGQSFETPGLVAEGKFKAADVRYTKADEIDVSLLRKWLAESATNQWDYKNIVKRKGRLERLS